MNNNPTCDTAGCDGPAFAIYEGTNKHGDRDEWFVCKMHEHEVSDCVVEYLDNE